MTRKSGSTIWDNRLRALTTFTLPLCAAHIRSQTRVRDDESVRCDRQVRVPAKAPGILTPDEGENLLKAAGDDILPLVSIQAFCGVRSAEALRLNGSDVDLTRGFV